MTPNPGVRAASRDFDSHVERQQEITRLRREFVGESQLTREELLAEQERLRAECRERHPSWGWLS